MTKPAKKRVRLWTMPDWMEPYREMIREGCGGLGVEELYNDASPWQVNAARAICGSMMKARVALMYRLHEAGLLSATFERRRKEKA